MRARRRRRRKRAARGSLRGEPRVAKAETFFSLPVRCAQVNGSRLVSSRRREDNGSPPPADDALPFLLILSRDTSQKRNL